MFAKRLFSIRPPPVFTLRLEKENRLTAKKTPVMLSKFVPDAKITVSVVLGVLLAGLVLKYAADLPILEDAAEGFGA